MVLTLTAVVCIIVAWIVCALAAGLVIARMIRNRDLQRPGRTSSMAARGGPFKPNEHGAPVAGATDRQ